MNISRIRHFNRDLTSYLGVYDRNLFNLHHSMLALRVVLEVDDHPGTAAKQLVKLLGVDKGYLSRVIRQLTVDGQLTRHQDPDDRRAWQLFVTDQGHQLARVVNEHSNKRVQKLMQQVPTDRQQEVLDSLELLQNALDQLRKED